MAKSEPAQYRMAVNGGTDASRAVHCVVHEPLREAVDISQEWCRGFLPSHMLHCSVDKTFQHQQYNTVG